MAFCSTGFLLCFLPVFFILYGLTPNKYKNMTLVSGSLVFYALGEPDYLFLLCVSVVVNYYIGIALGAERINDEKQNKKKKVILAAGIVGNAGILVLCKFGICRALPLGISFYTFQILSYLIDVYRGSIPGERSFLKMASYVVMFPKLVSGPIAEYGEVAEALAAPVFRRRNLLDGLKLFTVGLAAKVLLADRVGLLWNEVLVTGIESISTPLAWLAAVAYSMKIYFDFYGYTLMAMGLGIMMGFRFPDNFRTPYMAVSVRDFYRRWHITLGRWFRNYVYIPLGGNRKGELRTILNLFAVWVLTALWHGGTVNFLVWGMLLFGLIVIERVISRILSGFPAPGKTVRSALRALGHLYLWAVIPVTWVCFASPDTGEMVLYLCRMFGGMAQSAVYAKDWQRALQDYGGLLALCFVACTPLLEKCYRKYKDSMLASVILAALFWICVWRIGVEGGNPFLYLRF